MALTQSTKEKIFDGLITFWREGRTLPNFFSISRMIVSPITVLFLFEVFGASFSLFSFTVVSYHAAFVLCIYAGITDFLDGFLARILGKCTEFGARLDRRADKIWSWPVFGTLAYLTVIPPWLFILVLVRDLRLLLLNKRLQTFGGIKTTCLGKWKMALFFVYVALSAGLLNGGMLDMFTQYTTAMNSFHSMLTIVVAVMVVLSWWDYERKNKEKL
ncbi:MAG: CDP-alcohol phosphatidyltransferase family protein [bacterium]|nr:CDP-alcohol phosphatidyltransferase family protein [bacterium]